MVLECRKSREEAEKLKNSIKVLEEQNAQTQKEKEQLKKALHKLLKDHEKLKEIMKDQQNISQISPNSSFTSSFSAISNQNQTNNSNFITTRIGTQLANALGQNFDFTKECDQEIKRLLDIVKQEHFSSFLSSSSPISLPRNAARLQKKTEEFNQELEDYSSSFIQKPLN